jgi:hypothetical protein
MNTNFLWQDHSAYDDTTAAAVAKINPCKFIINIDGPGSDSSNPQCGPDIDQLTSFVSKLVSEGFSGSLVMHPDTTKGDYEHDWNGKGNLPVRASTDAYMSYCDYFREMNTALSKKSELLIETEASYIPKTPEMFANIRKYLTERLSQQVKLSSTGDWNINRLELGLDCVYPQLYDMAYVDSDLGGPNAPSKARANLLAEHISAIVSKKPAMLCDPNVFFAFSYCFNDKDAPVFGQPPRIWPQDLFMYFIKQFEAAMSKYSTFCNTGVWHCSTLLSSWPITGGKLKKCSKRKYSLLSIIIAPVLYYLYKTFL